MRLLPVAKGLATYIPFLYDAKRGRTGGTLSPRYCYSVWLRHFVLARQAGLDSNMSVVAELGPGDSMGIGIAALLSGANHLHAFDVVEYADLATNQIILKELLALFRRREPIPDDDEFPGVFPKLDCYAFPQNILSSGHLESALNSDRVSRIDAALAGKATDISISYHVPWLRSQNLPKEGRVDFVFSQAVLEHVADLSDLYTGLSGG